MKLKALICFPNDLFIYLKLSSKHDKMRPWSHEVFITNTSLEIRSYDICLNKKLSKFPVHLFSWNSLRKRFICSCIKSLLGAPSSFQRLMETVVQGIKNIIVYIDNQSACTLCNAPGPHQTAWQTFRSTCDAQCEN